MLRIMTDLGYDRITRRAVGLQLTGIAVHLKFPTESFTVLATERLIPPQKHQTHDQLVEPISSISQQPIAGLHGIFVFAYPDSRGFVILNASKLTRRIVPSYKDNANDSDDLYQMTKMTKRIRLESPLPRVSSRDRVIEQFPNDGENVSEIAACALTPAGMVVLESRGTIWILERSGPAT